MPAPPMIRPMVNSRPSGVSGLTSPKPTVLRVITVI
jgi:hypothetical protein